MVVGAIALKSMCFATQFVHRRPSSRRVFRRQIPPLPKVHEEAVGFIGLALCQLSFSPERPFLQQPGYVQLSARAAAGDSFGLVSGHGSVPFALYSLAACPGGVPLFPLRFELLFPGNGRLDRSCWSDRAADSPTAEEWPIGFIHRRLTG